jgi:radial spoke head protein 4A
MDHVIETKPKDASSLVEILSRMIKARKDAPAVDLAVVPPEELAQYAEKIKTLDKVPIGEDGEAVPSCAVADIMEEMEILSWAGVGFSEQECYKVACSLRNLGTKESANGVEKLRFWGKIMGSKADYYVAEAVKGGELEEGEDPDTEAPGTGSNQYAYYVTTDLAGEWKLLPYIRPREISSARAIKRILTGDPSAKVITHPYFKGKEEVLLRAQIARISADTTLCIKGQFTKDEEEGAEEEPPKENEEFVCPTPDQLLKKEGWSHIRGHILKNGRCSYLTKWENIEEDEENPGLKDKAKEEQEADPVPSVLRNLAEDNLGWCVKQAGDSTLYKFKVPLPAGADPEKPVQPRCNAVTYVKSQTWPGAISAARGDHVVNLYIGYGLPANQPDFFPPAPPDVQKEPDDQEEEAEPQGTVEADEAPAEDA